MYDSKPFLSDEYTFDFILNIDGFQPFKHVQYSVGAIYLCVLNLPRHICYKQEFDSNWNNAWTTRSKEYINSYLEPFTERNFGAVNI